MVPFQREKHSPSFGGRAIKYLYFIIDRFALENMNDQTGCGSLDLWPQNKTRDYDLVQANYSQLALIVVLHENKESQNKLIYCNLEMYKNI